jgi:hypothetical protein
LSCIGRIELDLLRRNHRESQSEHEICQDLRSSHGVFLLLGIVSWVVRLKDRVVATLWQGCRYECSLSSMFELKRLMRGGHVGTFRFTYDGKRIQPDDTPAGVRDSFVFSFFFLVFSESLLAGDGRWRSGGCFFAAGMRACFIVSFHE